MKKEMLKIAGVKSQKEFYSLYPTEQAFMAKHSKAFKKALLGQRIKKAQVGATQGGFNQQNAGMNTPSTSEADVQGAISNLSTGTKKETTGDTIAGVVKDIPVLGGLVQSVVDLWGAKDERLRQERAGHLSDLQLKASQSAPRQQNRKYNRPDMDANVEDINSLMPAEGTGSNLLGRDGITIARRGGEITNTYAPNTIYSNGGYEPLSESDRIKAYYNGGEIPQASFGSIVTSLLSSKGGSSGGGSGIMGMVGGLLGGGQTTSETTTLDPSQFVMRNNFSPVYVGGARDGNVIPKAQMGIGSAVNNGMDWITKIKDNPKLVTAAKDYGIPERPTGHSFVGDNLRNMGNSVIGSDTFKTNQNTSKINPTTANNINQATQATKSGIYSIPGLDNKPTEAAGNIGGTVGSVFGPIGSAVGTIVGTGLGAILRNKGGDKAMKQVQRNQNQMASTQVANVMQSNHQGNMRTGGNLKQNDSSEMEENGELNTLWGGHAEPMSYNPYLPDGGETVMFKGNSHEESDGHGRTGIGVRYGEGGELQPYDANVEVQNNEPAVKLKDEKGEDNLVVFGGVKISPYLSNILGDPEAKNKTFQRYAAKLSEYENKQNKIIEKATLQLEDLEPKTPYEKIKQDTLAISIKGADDKLKSIADKKEKAAHLQQAINDTAEERGIDADALAKGTIKAMKGAKVAKAQNGMNSYEELKVQKPDLYKKLQTLEKDKRRNKSKDDPDYKNWSEDYRKTRAEHNYTINELIRMSAADTQSNTTTDDDKDKMRNSRTSNISPSPIPNPFNQNNIVQNEEYFQNEPQNLGPINLEDIKPIQEKIVNTAQNKQRPSSYPSSNNLPNFGNLPEYINIGGEGMIDYNDPDKAGEIFIGKNYNKYWIPKVDRAFSNRSTAEELVRKLENYSGQDAADVKAVLAKEKTMDGKIKRAQELAKDRKVGPYHKIINSFIDEPIRMTPKSAALFNVTDNSIRNRKIEPLKTTTPETKTQPQFFNPLGSYLPSNKEELDPRQLTGEYYALATNQLEPVPAQQYHPTLKTPYEISLQDILNENTATLRSQQRLGEIAGNPAFQSQVAAQQYGANQKVLADQFRINQEAKMKVYDENTNILNDAQLKNLGILDTQYQRQAKAISNTKDTAREALSSISDKYMRNKLENETNAVYQNLYNYRYDQNQHAWNMNQPANFNMTGNGQSSTALPEDWETLYDKEGNPIKAQRKKKESRNGAILKAMRNL